MSVTVTGTITHTTVVVGANDPSKEVSKDAWNEEHTLSLSIDGLGTAAEANIVDFDAAGTAAAAIITHVGLADPHSQYALEASLAAVATSGAKADVGLGNVDNTSDASKPVSTATQTALDLKAPLASPTFTGTVAGITKSMVGLGSVDNTSDAGKPVSTAQQTALDLKANLASPTFTGTVGGITAAMVGLGSVNNTSDANKPVSTATQTALDAKQATLVSATNIKTINGATLLGSGDLTVSAGDPSYAPGSFTIATGTGKILTKNLTLTTTERATIEGTGRLRIT